MTETLSAAEARRMTLGAQGFSRRPPAAVASRHLHRAMDRMGVLQIDSVNVFARSHYMPMFSRLGAYDPALLDRLFLAGPTHYVEYLAHEAAFIPVGDWALWRFRMDDWRARAAKPGAWMHAHTRTLDWVRAELREHGPLRPADLRDDAPRERGSWWDWDEAKVALEHLWRCGDVAIAGRNGFERRYGLAEQVIPAAVRSRDVPRADAVRELVRRAARAYGVATEADLDDYHRLRDRTAVRAAIADLVDAGELEPVRVRGWERSGRPLPAWRHREAALPRRIGRAALLTPFDPLVWFRDRALRVFGLDYRIEIYVPAEKRRYGYYSLPVLAGDRIVARVDLKADRAVSTLRVQSAWWEPQGRDADAAAIAGELLRAAGWQRLERISVSGWGDAADAVARALHGRDVEVERHTHPREAELGTVA
ncbi:MULTISPECIES: winged helix-turn-helix domain-containing protein [Microbacterium]|uniref:winged helix-turn-helix domain-containing protein n=1 Tax=Microbacterium TaxID=33882 RepID=UPI00217E5279|nr:MULTISPECIES: crosslink repair DNA glycosylase YcaQ family protein [Microbacterium]UWF78059.1 YcaQ family DNA glycosylase [Microbacterium neungamense]WCM56237.1 YcaQ family DNA glycosylase [Microbacterium sp. EF45047]